jgi:hypothetical protein
MTDEQIENWRKIIFQMLEEKSKGAGTYALVMPKEGKHNDQAHVIGRFVIKDIATDSWYQKTDTDGIQIYTHKKEEAKKYKYRFFAKIAAILLCRSVVQTCR